MKKIIITGGSGFIGTNLIEKLIHNLDYEILNIDIKAPKINSHKKYWLNLDIRDKKMLTDELRKFKPDMLIHFAARTDLRGETIEDYSTNILGTENLVEVLNEIGFQGMAVFTSSMYVCEPGYKPKDFNDYNAHTIYGESKVKSEIIIKSADKQYPSVIVRPTSIWGPWFGEPYSDFFNIVLSKKYVHISTHSCKKTYGYIGNTIAQIEALMTSDPEKIDGNVYYLGDWPEYNISVWADEIADTVPYKVKTFPVWFFKGLALFGDLLKFFGVKFPMTSFRLKNMTTNNVHDLSLIRNVLPTLPIERKEGITRTINWLKDNNK